MGINNFVKTSKKARIEANTKTKTGLLSELEAKTELLNNLRGEISTKSNHLKTLNEEINHRKKKLSEINENALKIEASKKDLEKKLDDVLSNNQGFLPVNEIKFLSMGSCVRWNLHSENENFIQGFLAEKDNFRLINIDKGDRSWFSISDEIWGMMNQGD